MKYELGFLGAGNMAEAIAKAALAKGLLRAEQMVAADPVEERRRVFGTLGIRTAENPEVVAQCALCAAGGQAADATTAQRRAVATGRRASGGDFHHGRRGDCQDRGDAGAAGAGHSRDA